MMMMTMHKSCHTRFMASSTCCIAVAYWSDLANGGCVDFKPIIAPLYITLTRLRLYASKMHHCIHISCFKIRSGFREMKLCV